MTSANVGAGDGTRTIQGSGMSGLPAIQRLVGRENWPSWKFAVQMYLEHEDLWEIVKPTANADGTFPAVDPVKDRKTKAKIALLLDPVNYVHVQDATSARDAWFKLEQAFDDSGPERKVGLLYKLINTKLVNCDSMADYVNRIVSTSMQLRGIGFDVSEEWVGALLLAGLPTEYKPMVMAITNSGIALKGDLIKTKLLQEVEEPSVKVALATKNQKQQPQTSKGPKCRSCHRFGHIAKDCPSKKRQNSVKNESALSTVLSTIDEAEEDSWYFDSGATTHLTKNGDALKNMRSGGGLVTAANRGVMKVVATGDIKLKAGCCPGKPALTVRDVQFIPELTTNLLSVSQIVDKGCKVIFDKHGCKVLSSEGNVFATGTRINNLFKFDTVKQSQAMVCQDVNQAELWHRRMGHINIRSLMQLRSGLVTGVKFNSNAYADCKVCALGKQARLPFSKKGSRAEMILELVHSDICGPMEVASIGGSRYYITFVDDKTRRVYIYFLKTKSAEEVLEVFREYRSLAENQTGLKLKTIRTDNGKEYINNAFQGELKKHGIRHQCTVDYTPQHNGMAERVNRSVVERARCMLFEAGLPKRFWAEAASTAVYLLNRSPTKGHRKTPEQAWSGKQPDLSHLRIFGTTVMAHVPKQKRRKWDAKAEECILVGYMEDTKGYRVFNRSSQKVTVSRDVTFLNEGGETKHGLEMDVPSTEPGVDYVSLNFEEQVVCQPDSSRAVATLSDQELQSIRIRPRMVQALIQDQPGPSSLRMVQALSEVPLQEESETIVRDTSLESADDENDAPCDVTLTSALPPYQSSNPPESQVLRRSGRERELPGKLKDFYLIGKGLPPYNVSAGSTGPITPGMSSETTDDLQGLMATGQPRKQQAKDDDDPCTLVEALNGEQAALWRAAMQEEYDSLNKNGTWDLVEPPPNRKIVRCKWIFKTKRDSNGKIIRYKARLVAKGFTQKYGFDYDEVFAPVVRQSTFRTLLAVAAKRNMSVKQYDFKTAFLNGDLEEEIYMCQPPAFAVPGCERKVCRLKKSLYGLKQAARSWNMKLHSVLEKEGFKRSKADPCLYSKVSNRKRCYVLVYVDDLIVASESTGIHDTLVAALESNFEISQLGDIHYYLGIEVERDQNGDFFLNQQKYIKQVVESSGLGDAKVSKMPLDPGYLKQDGEGQPLQNNNEYQKVVGQLLYLSVNTRPDISAAISIMSRKTANPTQADWVELKRIIRYLKGTSHYRLRVSKTADKSGLVGYSDADFAENTTDRKSNSGHIFMFNGGTISWSCRKQTSVALSTAEAEFIALAEATQESLWLKRLLVELHEEGDVTIYEDNQSCLKMLDQEKFSNRTKHISTKYHFIRDVKEKKEVTFIYCPTEEMVADLLTKPLNGVRILKLAKASGLVPADRGGVLE